MNYPRLKSLAFVILTLTSCTTSPRTNTRRIKETTLIFTKEYKVSRESYAAFSADSVIKYAATLTMKVLASILRGEAEKFDTTWSATTTTNLPSSWKPWCPWLPARSNKVVAWTVVRFINIKDDKGTILHDFPSEGMDKLPTALQINDRIANWHEDLGRDYARIKPPKGGPKEEWRVAFAAYGRVYKNESGHTISATLDNYTYPAMKAKRYTRQLLFFFGGNEKSGLLTWRMRGPRGVSSDTYSNNFAVAVTPTECDEWRNDKNSPFIARAGSWAVPQNREVRIDVQLTELSNLNKLVKKLAGKMETYEISVDDFK